MELRWLEDFIVLAETRHFSRAADLQNVTQPTFSRRIKLLEESMGATLIDRQTLPLSLTPAGDEFLLLCKQITERVKLTRERLQNLAHDAAQRIKLAAPQSLVTHFVAGWLSQHGLMQQVEPYLRATSWLIGDYFQALERGEVDLALCYWPEGRTALDLDLSGLRYLEIGEERLVPVSLPEADGRPRFSLPGEKRAPLPHIAYHPSGLIAAAMQAHWSRSRQEVHLTTLNENVQTSNIRELVQQGYGLGWLPWRTVSPLLERGDLTRAGDRRWDVPLSLRLYFRQDSRHPGLPAVLAQLQEQLDDSH
ncbi:LysR family transcriptional regulator [Salinicola rhizosphaerae]|uniref:LysR family transcriptional regulator n=1 Tax=Salinicola rhizosphaerae TaxID=1443141 RepID=A0ABQ3DPI0_9GAMM|nr:LysR family transcriptional regulator [Salinicola rhizosphaerae]GHB09262.1 LysR family transcriptional regulator [Salinicola rhizosphaerae]